uniref:non-specific serine/threonine protein kinase n=1 Tax=Oryza punctata TaxID=4537 RepID=A0A0E0KNJ9_ORYPU
MVPVPLLPAAVPHFEAWAGQAAGSPLLPPHYSGLRASCWRRLYFLGDLRLGRSAINIDKKKGNGQKTRPNGENSVIMASLYLSPTNPLWTATAYRDMSRWHRVLLFLCLLHSMLGISCGCIPEERAALMEIRSSLMSAQSEPPVSWSGRGDCCSWERIRCNNSTRPVQTTDDGGGGTISVSVSACINLNLTILSSFRELQLLDFSSNDACIQNFEGLEGLSKLQYLNLSGNSLSGSIPGSISKLVSLKVINLDRNNISGALQNKDVINLRNLQELHLRSNRLSGTLPSSLFALPRLQYLDLSENLFEGFIPVNSSWNCSSFLQTLKLSGNDLSGKFEFFWLRYCGKLQRIDLSGNANLVVQMKFPGWVPQFQLKTLRLSGCKLDKSIIAEPHFLRTQSRLEFLDLSNNNLPGRMPNWLLTDEATIVYLDISNNMLDGSLNLMLQQQFSLQLLNISRNSIIGELPTNISSVFPNLRILDVSHNIISGVIPLSLCSIHNIELLDLSNNKFIGEVPACLFTDWSELKILKVSNNNLGGMILSGASNLSTLWEIYLDSNKFEGSLPINLSGEGHIMDLHGNNISGRLDTSFWNLSLLEALILAGNSLTGEIRYEFCSLTSVKLLDLSDNSFAGPLPNCSTTLPLNFLNMSCNSLSGSPDAFFNPSYIEVLDLSYNQFTGNLEWIRELSQISHLLLRRNKFEGRIPSDLCHLQFMRIVDFSHNILSGSVPPCIGNIPFEVLPDYQYLRPTTGGSFFGGGFESMDLDDSSYMYDSYYDMQGFTFTTKGNPYTYGQNIFFLMFGIDFSANMLSGEIPKELGNMSHIKSLNLSYNFFTGQIPPTFANMSEIESLDLSHNRLIGPIPWQLTRLSSLEVFSVAYNNLSGCVPNTAQFGSFQMDSYEGNTNLHKASQGSKSCTSNSSPATYSEMEGKVLEDFDPILYLVTAVSFVLAFCATFWFSFCPSIVLRV